MGRGPLEGPLRARHLASDDERRAAAESDDRWGSWDDREVAGWDDQSALSGGRFAPSPSPAPPRWVGRIVVGPSGETLRVGAGLGGTTRERTTFAALAAGAAGAGATAAGVVSTGAAARRDGRHACGRGGCGRGRGGCRFLHGLGCLCGFFGFRGLGGDLTAKSVGVGASADAVGLCVFDRRGRARGADT